MYVLNCTDVYLVRAIYVANEGLCVIAYTKDGEEYAVLTKSFPEFPFFGEKDLAFIDVNNYPGIEGFLDKYDIAKSLHFGIDSGFVTYPLYKFDLSKLIGEDNYEESNYNHI